MAPSNFKTRVCGAFGCFFLHAMMSCGMAGMAAGISKQVRVRVRRETALDRSGVMAEVMGLTDKEFKRFYRMDKSTFLFVLGRVRPHLETGNNHRGDKIMPDVALACVLTWLRGGSHLDACRIHKISPCARSLLPARRARASGPTDNGRDRVLR